MTKQELLAQIIDIIDPIDDITEDTVIADCEDFDSLALFNIMVLLKGQGLNVDIKSFASCKTVADILNFIG